MKILFLILLFSACTKIKNQEIKKAPEKQRFAISVQNDWSGYSPNIDVIVAFLWPEVVAPQDRPKLTRIIEVSRELKIRNSAFQKKKIALKSSFELNHCACVLNGECTGSEENMNEQLCYEIEEATYANDRLLIDIFGLVEVIKENVLSIGGLWLATHLDLREIPTSKIDFTSMAISFSALGTYNEAQQLFPISYVTPATSIIQEKDFQRLEVSFPRQTYENGVFKALGLWTIDVGITQSDESILFQGELYWNYRGKQRQGIIYWENPKL
jgi:hypothetical protein